jgi:hypothetical protein
MSYMRGPGETGNKAVKYTPCNKGDQTDEDELDEIAVVGANDEPQNAQAQVATAGEQQGEEEEDPTAKVNGPRSLPGGGFMSPTDRTKLIEGDARTGSSGTISVATSHRVSEGGRGKTESRHSLMDLVSNRIERLGQRKSHCYTRDEIAFLSKARANDYLTPREIRKMRRKEIDEKFGKKYKIREKIEQAEKTIDTGPRPDKGGCRWTFVFDPSGRLSYWWSFVVSIAFVYNFWVIVYRFAFAEISENNMVIWFSLDYTADLVYILDIAFHFRTGFLDEGVLQTDTTKLRLHYMNTTVFYIDCLCLLPLDFLYLSIGFKSMPG